MSNHNKVVISRTVIYVAMIVMLAAIAVGAYHNAPPILLAVGFVGEIILVSTAHLSSVIERHDSYRSASHGGGADR
jgi:hypothetical protein